MWDEPIIDLWSLTTTHWIPKKVLIDIDSRTVAMEVGIR